MHSIVFTSTPILHYSRSPAWQILSKPVYSTDFKTVGHGFWTGLSKYILSQEPFPEVVTIVAMGNTGVNRAPEDEGCAGYLEHLITGNHYNHLKTLERMVFGETAQKFLGGEKVYLPREDPLFCLQRDLFDFVLIAGKEKNLG